MARNGLGSLAGLLMGVLVSTAGAARDGAGEDSLSSLEVIRAGGGAEEAENPRAVFSTENSIRREIAVAEGQTLGWILRSQGVEDAEARRAAGALGRHVDLRRLRVGQELTILLAPRPTGAIGYRLIGMALAMPRGKAAVALRRFDDRFDASLAPAAEAEALLGSITVVADDGEPGFMSRELSLSGGDGFDGLLIRNGAAADDARAASRLLAEQVDLRALPVGQKITAIFRRAGEDSRARLVGAAIAMRDGAAHTVGIDGAGRWRTGPPAIDPVAPEDRTAVSDEPGETAETKEPEETEETASAGDSIADAPAEDTPRASLAEPDRATVGRGGTFIGLLLGVGFSRSDAREAVNAIGALYDLRKLPAGAAVKYARVAVADGEARLGAIGFDIDKTSRLEVFRRADGSLSAEIVEKNLRRAWRRIEGTVDSSLFVAATNAGAPADVVMNLIRVLGFSVDFERDVKSGDRFSLIYETLLDDDGRSLKSGALHFASLTLSGDERTVYRYLRADGRAGYFDGDGKNVRKALMRTPLDGARLVTSGFGMRRHPIRGFNRMHKGVDFGAPSGTRVYASGDGVVERATRMGGYGRYVRIRHNSAYKTAYAHLSAFARGLHPGMRVSQGDVIGYVGSSGMSTGPHLHYEVLYEGRQVNPLSVELPSGDPLDDAELAAFAPHRHSLDRLNSRLPLSAAVPFDIAAGGAPLDGPIRTAANR